MREGITLERKKITQNWIRPNLENERDEIKRAIYEFLDRLPTEEDVNEITKVIEVSPMVSLSYDDWRHLNNTDSFRVVRTGFLEDAKKITEENNLKLLPENKHDFENILSGYENGSPMECPIIMRNKGKLHLVSGNTRLMISRAKNIYPKVIIVDVR